MFIIYPYIYKFINTLISIMTYKYQGVIYSCFYNQ